MERDEVGLQTRPLTSDNLDNNVSARSARGQVNLQLSGDGASNRGFSDWVHLGESLVQSRNYGEAMAAYTSASQLDPASPEVLAALADLHALLGDDSAALERYLDSYAAGANAKAKVGANRILARYAAPRPLDEAADELDREILAEVFRGAAAAGATWRRPDRGTLQALVGEQVMAASTRLGPPSPPTAGDLARRAATYAWARRRLGVPGVSQHVTYHPLDAHLPLFLTLQSYLAGVEPGHASAGPARAVALLMSFPAEFRGVADGLRLAAPPFAHHAVTASASDGVAQAFLATLVAPQIERSLSRLPRLQESWIREELSAGDLKAACAVLQRHGAPLSVMWGYPGGLRFDAAGRLDAAAMFEQGAGDGAADPYLFDRDFYLKRYGGGGAESDPYLDYLLKGASQWRRPHRLFASHYYADRIGAGPGQHLFAAYLFGDAEPISPTPLFDPAFYVAMYPEVGAAVRDGLFASALHHFLMHGAAEGKAPSSDWDADYYIASNDDVRAALDLSNPERAHAMAFDHFLRFGLAENRAPSEFFDGKFYVEAYPEVREEVRKYDLLGPFEHFAWIGRAKGYRCRAPLHALAVPELHAKALYMKRCQASAFDLQTGRTITLRASDDPFFSVIVPCKDNFPYTARALKLLRDAIGYAASDAGLGVEVILVDDASSDATTKAPELVANLRYVRREASGGYPVACNAGAAVARGKYLIFMNNDLEFEADLLSQLHAIIERDAHEVGCFGVAVTLMTGVLQDTGSSVWGDGTVRGHDRGEPVWRRDLQSPREVDFVSGCFLCISRAEFERLGGFSESYAPGYFEEVDLCARVWRSGRKVRVYPAIRIAHFESGSFNSGKGRMAAAALMMRNRDRFVAANLDFVRGKLPFAEAGSAYSRPLNTGRPRCLFIEDFVPDRSRGSGYGRAEVILRYMAAIADVQVFAAYRTNGQPPAYSDWFHVQYGPDPALLARCLAREQIDCVYICRPHNMDRYAAVLAQWKRNTGGQVIYDAEAIFSVREFIERTGVESYAAMTGDPVFESMVRDELRCVGEVANSVVTVNELEAGIAGRVTGRRVATIGHFCESRTSRPPGLHARAGLLFVGAFHSPATPNFDAVRWFAKHVMPRIVAERPDTVLSIVGYLADGVDLSPITGPNVIYVGSVDDLTASYDMARVFVAPSRIGAGIPIKVIEAVSNGLPCVASTLLAEQLQVGGRPEPSVLAATTKDDGEAFAAQCLLLLNDDRRWRDLQAAAIASAKSYNSKASLAQGLEQVLNLA